VGSRREQVLVVALILLALALGFLTAPDPEQSVLDPRPSTFRNAPPGALALYLTLQEIGIPVERRLTSWTEGDPLAPPLALLAPTQMLTPLEVEALVEWVEEGGSLIYAAQHGDTLLAALGLVLHPLGEPGSGPARPQPHPWTAGIDSVPGFRWAFADTSQALVDRQAIPLLAAEDGAPVVVYLPRGQGRVVAWSDVDPLVNQRLRQSGAAVLFGRVAVALTAEEEALVFDEFHHGYREGAGVAVTVLRFLRDTGPGRMVLQMGVAGLGLLLLMGRRFGEPHPPPSARRRSPLEHVEALAGAYRQGGARATARRQVIAGLARRLGRPVPAPDAEGEWLRKLGARHGRVREPAEALLAEWSRGTRSDLAALTHHADRIVTQLRHR
jgi:hypothetical protein